MTAAVHSLPPAQGDHTKEAARLDVKILDADGLLALDADAWKSLSAAALAENPYYARRYVLAGIDTVDRRTRMRALAFTSPAGELVGLFPFNARSKVPSPFPVANMAANDFQFSGMPLVHRDHATAVIDAWLDMIARGTVPATWVLTNFYADSRLCELLLDGSLSRGLCARLVNRYERAVLTRGPGSLAAHLKQAVSKNRLYGVRRTIRRLEELGRLTFEHTDDPVAFAARFEQFLALEDSGWKARGGTSILSNADTEAFARRAFAPCEGFAALDSLLLDGKPLAMRLSIRTGTTAFTPKSAYDEAHSKLGPGMALHFRMLEHFYTDLRLDGIDASATTDGNSALNFYDRRAPMATLVLGARPWQVRLIAFLHREREVLKRRISGMLGRGR